MSANLYEMDRAAWLTRQVELIKSGRFALVDQEHLLEELEAEVGNYRREIKRRLRVLIAHLLKWKYQPDRRSSSWRGTIRVQRIDIADLLKDNPSLRQTVRQAIEDAYSDAVKLAADETGMLEDAYPASCEWEESELLNPDFWPE
jgi:Lhr-like helicase